jgi:predicted Zn-dependent protease
VSDSEGVLSSDRIKLIFEFNEHSPLFARVASMLIEKGNIIDAVRILKSGILDFPSYSTAYFILALAYAYSGEEEKAINSAAAGRDLLGSEETFKSYEEKIRKIIFERNTLSEATRPAFLREEGKDSDNEGPDKLEDTLDLLAERLSKAKIIPKDPEEQTSSSEPEEIKIKKIFSDTMAEIFLSQRNYNEALDIYTELLKQRPDRAGIYLQKISDINSMME